MGVKRFDFDYGLASSLNEDRLPNFDSVDINNPFHPSNKPNQGFTPNPTIPRDMNQTQTQLRTGLAQPAESNFSHISKHEGIDNKYDTKNMAGSSAYGRYQFMPSTAKMYASKIGINPEQWQVPANQEAIMKYADQDYAKYLNRWDRENSPSNRYVVHQLGPARARRYFTNTLTDSDVRVMNENLPQDLKAEKQNDIIRNWMNKYNPMEF